MKATLTEVNFHKQILAKDDIAFTKLHDLYSKKTIQKLKWWYKNIARMDEAWILEAVSDAFLNYYLKPEAFDPRLGTLQRYLEVAANRDLLNIIKRERKFFLKKDLPEDVELHEKFWNSITKSSIFTDSTIEMKEILEIVQLILQEVFSTETDLEMAFMIIARERETHLYSKVLEIEELELSEQVTEVKKQKDRIKQMLKRKNIETRIKNLLK